MLKAVNLCKQFEKTIKSGRKTKKQEFLAVDHVSIEAGRGEIIGILGPNGAGKTTLLRMLGNLMSPTKGEIYLYDRNGNKIVDEIERKKSIGYLSGNTRLYPRFSIREYLSFLGEIYGMEELQIKKRIEELITLFSMEEFADNRIEKLSTGQIQRASICRTLMSNPGLYILDEPTLGLDILSADAIINFMLKQKQEGKTILYSTHYLEEAEAICDRIYMIFQGKIVAEGSPLQLMKDTGTVSLRSAFQVIFKEMEGK